MRFLSPVQPVVLQHVVEAILPLAQLQAALVGSASWGVTAVVAVIAFAKSARVTLVAVLMQRPLALRAARPSAVSDALQRVLQPCWAQTTLVHAPSAYKVAIAVTAVNVFAKPAL